MGNTCGVGNFQAACKQKIRIQMNLNSDIINKYEDVAVAAEKEIAQNVDKALQDKYSKRRWFWELMQNAIDTVVSEQDRKIQITLDVEEVNSEKKIAFSHNGGNFKDSKRKYRYDDFKNLIIPISGKILEDENTIGKFGTGFLSTHILSLKVKIEGVFEKDINQKMDVTTTLDRTKFLIKTEDARNERIESIIKSLAKYHEKNELQLEIKNPSAKFTYFLDYSSDGNLKKEWEVVDIGLQEIKESLGFVLSFNSKVEKITINDKRDNK